jgi:hypothetical protein
MQLCGAISSLRNSEMDDLLHLLTKCDGGGDGAKRPLEAIALTQVKTWIFL